MLHQIVRTACALCLLVPPYFVTVSANAQTVSQSMAQQSQSEKAAAKKSAKKNADRAARPAARRGDGGESGPTASGMWERHDARNGY